MARQFVESRSHGRPLVDMHEGGYARGLGWGVLMGNIAKVAIAALQLGLEALQLPREAVPMLLGSTPGQHGLKRFIF